MIYDCLFIDIYVILLHTFHIFVCSIFIETNDHLSVEFILSYSCCFKPPFHEVNYEQGQEMDIGTTGDLSSYLPHI